MNYQLMSEWFILKHVLRNKPSLSCGDCVMQAMALLDSFLFIVAKLVRSAAKKG